MEKLTGVNILLPSKGDNGVVNYVKTGDPVEIVRYCVDDTGKDWLYIHLYTEYGDHPSSGWQYGWIPAINSLGLATVHIGNDSQHPEYVYKAPEVSSFYQVKCPGWGTPVPGFPPPDDWYY